MLRKFANTFIYASVFFALMSSADANSDCSLAFKSSEIIVDIDPPFALISRPFLSPVLFIEYTPYSRLIEHDVATA